MQSLRRLTLAIKKAAFQSNSIFPFIEAQSLGPHVPRNVKTLTVRAPTTAPLPAQKRTARAGRPEQRGGHGLQRRWEFQHSCPEHLAGGLGVGASGTDLNPRASDPANSCGSRPERAGPRHGRLCRCLGQRRWWPPRSSQGTVSLLKPTLLHSTPRESGSGDERAPLASGRGNIATAEHRDTLQAEGRADITHLSNPEAVLRRTPAILSHNNCLGGPSPRRVPANMKLCSPFVSGILH